MLTEPIALSFAATAGSWWYWCKYGGRVAC
jgi:hypothetical protein